MFSSSPALPSPATPHSNRSRSHRQSNKPLNSSPLAQNSSPPFSSPVAEAQARRKSQYKNRTPSHNSTTSSGSRTNSRSRAPPFSLWSSNAAPPSSADDQKAFLRDRFRSRCLERASKAREKARSSRRSEPSSDGLDDAMEDDVETEEDVLQDELYRRIVLNNSHRTRHEYRRSYYAEVGSSFDPDLEDIADWEDDIDAQPNPAVSHSDMTPEELELAELEAYAEECERQAAFADFEDIPIEELLELDNAEFSTHDAEDANTGSDADMDMHI